MPDAFGAGPWGVAMIHTNEIDGVLALGHVRGTSACWHCYVPIGHLAWPSSRACDDTEHGMFMTLREWVLVCLLQFNLPDNGLMQQVDFLRAGGVMRMLVI